MFKVCHYDKADNDEEKPRSYLLKTNEVPFVDLTGVLPGSVKRCHIFSYPHEETD